MIQRDPSATAGPLTTHRCSSTLLRPSPAQTDAATQDRYYMRKLTGRPSVSLSCDWRELLLFAGVQLTRLLARVLRPPISISGQRWLPAPTGTALNSSLCCTRISRNLLTNGGFLAKMQRIRFWKKKYLDVLCSAYKVKDG